MLEASTAQSSLKDRPSSKLAPTGDRLPLLEEKAMLAEAAAMLGGGAAVAMPGEVTLPMEKSTTRGTPTIGKGTLVDILA